MKNRTASICAKTKMTVWTFSEYVD